MTIYKKEMYACKCSLCGIEWVDNYSGNIAFNDKEYLIDCLTDHYWLLIEDDEYCPECHYIDDDGEARIKKNKLRKLKLNKILNKVS